MSLLRGSAFIYKNHEDSIKKEKELAKNNCDSAVSLFQLETVKK